MYTSKNYLLGAAALVGGDFAHLQRFADFVSAALPEHRVESAVLVADVEYYVSDAAGVEVKDHASALRHLAARDLSRLLQVLRQHDQLTRIEEQLSFDTSLAKYRDAGVSVLHALGLKVSSPKFWIVDHLPAPYDRASYAVIAPDADDYSRYGISPGLYFLRSRLRPFFSPFILLHELVHTVFGERSPDIFARGLEEGMAEVFGSMYLAKEVFGAEMTRRLFELNRLGYPQTQFWNLYLDFTRQAGYLYQRYGLRGYVRIFHDGRGLVKELEARLSTGRLNDIQLESGDWDSALDELVGYLTMTFPVNLVVSPLARYLADYVRPGLTVREILTAAGVANTQVMRDALEELQARAVVAVFDKEFTVASLSDMELLSNDYRLRYEIPEA